uniref:Uncharacterized protein n=1 Tax=Manihot esculenta TaxID=3983 RepID=A0A2C9U9D5_MANES
MVCLILISCDFWSFEYERVSLLEGGLLTVDTYNSGSAPLLAIHILVEAVQ